MAVLHEIHLEKIKNNDNIDEIRRIIARQFWFWLESHWNDRLTTIKILIFKKTIRVRDLESLYVLLLGPRP